MGRYPYRHLWTVTRWEFLRYFKWKQELIGIGIMLLLFVALMGGERLMDRAKQRQSHSIALVGAEILTPVLAPDSRLGLEFFPEAALPELEARVGDGELTAVLQLHSIDEARLLVRREPGWLPELRRALDEARRSHYLGRAGVKPETLAIWLSPLPLEVQFHPQGEPPAARQARMAALVSVGLMMMGVFVGFAYFFASITSEKQQRVSEQILSAIPPQVWIDGKILGISLLGIKSMLTLGLWLAVGFAVGRLFSGGSTALALPGAGLLLVLILFALLGLLFWNSFMAAVAATIDDPNSSARSSLMFVPMVPLMLTFFGLDAPDNLMMVLLSHLPLTSMAAMPARFILGGVPVWELLLSLGLLVLGIALIRRLASRIFRLGMLLYGKEPRFAEIWRWLRTEPR